jgi:hypothetical protein
VPLYDVTCTSTVPALWAGEVAVIDAGEFTVNEVAATPPKVTPIAPVKFVPVSATEVPPAVVPVVVPRLVTVGSEAVVYVNTFPPPVADVPADVVTVTLMEPEYCGGDVAAIEVAEFTVNDKAGTVPNSTLVAPVKFVPVKDTDVPPAVLPPEGLSPVTVGAPAVT